jgi:hypothetical protein
MYEAAMELIGLGEEREITAALLLAAQDATQNEAITPESNWRIIKR